MKEIKLGRNGLVALVDDEDYEYLMQWKWHTSKVGDVCYAIRLAYEKNGDKTLFLMHRVIMNTPKGMLTDHINHNGLDNRRCNLRVCNSSQNTINSRRNSKSGYKGVEYTSYGNRVKPFFARIRVDGYRIFLGYFKTDIEAAIAYDMAAIKHFGEYACINFPNINVQK